ncbi:FAD-dependent oxidoreductase [Aeromicrobium alkaliterrae]|uniref:FAD-binding oxidoreductase n=1 Tax=Aeromicrobium alkaliterrae TaxID=302168 RepID=A0ABP4VRZ1_9ACTN
MTLTADAVVIGCGVVGASVALSLRRSGRSVVVLDKGGAPGHGSTSASSAIVRFNYSTWAGVATSWESRFRWEAWEDHLGFRDPAGLARFERRGMVFLDTDALPRDRMSALFRRAGIPFEEWDARALAARVPGIDAGRYHPPKAISDPAFFDDAAGSLGAVFTPDAGFVDDPQLAAANLARAAEALGARLLLRRTVTQVERVGQTWRVVLSDDDVVEAPVVVNAAGPWSGAVNRLAEIGDDFTISVTPLRQEVHHVPRLTGPSAATMPVVSDVDLGTYLRPDATGGLLVGSTEPECDPLEWLSDPDAADPRPTLDRFEAQVWRAARRLPDLAVPSRPSGVAGVYDAASDWTPIYDRTAAPGFYVAMGTSGNQFKNAPLVGDLMTTLIDAVEAGHDHDADPVVLVAPHTGHRIDLGAFSRRREVNADSSGTVVG